MSETTEGPRVWNRADVLTVLDFVGGGHYGARLSELMQFVESFHGTTDSPPADAPQVKAALAPEAPRQAPPAKQARKANRGWTPERRARQAEIMRRTQARIRAEKVRALTAPDQEPPP